MNSNKNNLKKAPALNKCSENDLIIYDSTDEGIVIRKAHPIEDYFNTLPPLEGNFKEEISSYISERVRK
jgi:hypothetical protein